MRRERAAIRHAVNLIPLSYEAAPLKGPRLPGNERARILSLSSPGASSKAQEYAFEKYGHLLARRDEDRLADLNDALRDPAARALRQICL